MKELLDQYWKDYNDSDMYWLQRVTPIRLVYYDEDIEYFQTLESDGSETHYWLFRDDVII